MDYDTESSTRKLLANVTSQSPNTVIFIYMTSHNMTSQVYTSHEIVKDTDRINLTPCQIWHGVRLQQPNPTLVLIPFQNRINFAQ